MRKLIGLCLIAFLCFPLTGCGCQRDSIVQPTPKTEEEMYNEVQRMDNKKLIERIYSKDESLFEEYPFVVEELTSRVINHLLSGQDDPNATNGDSSEYWHTVDFPNEKFGVSPLTYKENGIEKKLFVLSISNTKKNKDYMKIIVTPKGKDSFDYHWLLAYKEKDDDVYVLIDDASIVFNKNQAPSTYKGKKLKFHLLVEDEKERKKVDEMYQ